MGVLNSFQRILFFLFFVFRVTNKSLGFKVRFFEETLFSPLLELCHNGISSSQFHQHH